MPNGISETELAKFMGKVSSELGSLNKGIENLSNTQDKQMQQINQYLDQMKEIVTTCRADHRQELTEIDHRLKTLESYKDRVTGGLIAVSVAVTTAWGKILKII